MANEDKTFIETITELQKIPEDTAAADSFDFPQFFGATQDSVVQSKLQPENIGLTIKCKAHSEVYVIWRPWETCGRCKNAIASGNISLPDTGDHTCPHTQKVDYKNTLDTCLSGKYGLYKHEYFNLKNGTRCVHLTWLEEDPEFALQRKLKEEALEKNRVWPPDVEKAFSDTAISKSTKKKKRRPE